MAKFTVNRTHRGWTTSRGSKSGGYTSVVLSIPWNSTYEEAEAAAERYWANA